MSIAVSPKFVLLCKAELTNIPFGVWPGLIYSLPCVNSPLKSQLVEAYGIFCIGEMIGRRNLVGYKLEDH